MKIARAALLTISLFACGAPAPSRVIRWPVGSEASARARSRDVQFAFFCGGMPCPFRGATQLTMTVGGATYAGQVDSSYTPPFIEHRRAVVFYFRETPYPGGINVTFRLDGTNRIEIVKHALPSLTTEEGTYELR